jgi:plasmid stability protein
MSRTKKDSQAIWIDSTVHQQLKLIAAMNDRTIGDEAGEVLKKHITENQHKVLSAFEKKMND